MPPRIRIAITILAALAALGILVPVAMSGYRAANRPPVVITIPPQDTASPLPYANKPPKPAIPATSAPSPDSSAGTIYVHVAGAVRHPSVYKLAAGLRVFDAVKAAGGALPKADTDAINLAEPLRDGEKVYVPVKGEVASSEIAGNGDQAGAVASPNVPATRSGRRRSSGSSSRIAKLKSPASGTIDINTASASLLQRLPGVGPAMAARIIAQRHTLGGFRKPTDLLYVPGIGAKKYKKLLPYLRF